MGYPVETDGISNTEKWFPYLQFSASIDDLFNNVEPERFSSIMDHANRRWGNHTEVRVIPQDLSLLHDHLLTTEVVKSARANSRILVIYDVKGLFGSTNKYSSTRPYKYPPNFDTTHFEKVSESLWGRLDLDPDIRGKVAVFGRGGGELE